MLMRHSALSRTLGLLALCLTTACAGPEVDVKKAEHLELTRVAFDALPGWGTDNHAQAIEPFRRSCAKLMKQDPMKDLGLEGMAGRVADWAEACTQATRLETSRPGVAQAFFESYFVPYQVTNNGNPQGLFTGYYEAELRGSPVRTAQYSEPLYKLPANMKKPYYSRAQIEKGALRGKGLELAYSDDPVGVFFMHIQGSGRVVMPDGSVLKLGYAGQNGHEYVAIGKTLADRGLMPRDQVNAPSIMAWLRENPAQMREIMRANPSFIFFKEIQGDTPIGAQGVVLVPERSLAVDRKYFPMGAPLWLVTTSPETPTEPSASYQRLMIAQDTGGAIKGPVRGDVFFGRGPVAVEKAGYMKNRGTYFVLLPNRIDGSRVIATR